MKFKLSACFSVGVLILAACAQSPLEKTVAGLGGKEALQSMTALAIEATGTRWRIDEFYSPGDVDQDGTPFTMQLHYDIAGDKLRLDYTRDRSSGEQEMSLILDGQLGVAEGQNAQYEPPATEAITSDRWAAARKEQRLLNPHLILRKVLADPTRATEGGEQVLDGIKHHVLVVDDEVAPIRFYVNASTGYISKAETVENEPLRRDVRIEVVYENWATVKGGLSFPSRVRLSLDGERIHEEVRSSIEVNQALDPALFDFPAEVQPEFDSELAEWGARNHQLYQMWEATGFPYTGRGTTIEAREIAPRVHYVRGSSHHSLVIEQEEGIVVAEAPLHEHRSEAVIKWIRATFPGKPITHVIATHHHGDHSAGLRTYVAEGVPIVVHEAAKAFYENIFQAPSTIVPDPLALNPVAATIETVPADGPFTIPDAAVPVYVYPFENSHAEDLVFIYVPNGGVVFVADVYNPNHVTAGEGVNELADAIVANNLNVSMIVGVHGETIAYDDFRALLGR